MTIKSASERYNNIVKERKVYKKKYMKIKRILLATFASMLMSQATFAVPAYPGVIKAKQADGTEISIRLHGDEHGNYRTTEDGFLLMYNSATRNYEYATVTNGVARCSGIVAADAAKRTNQAKSFLATIDKQSVISLYNKQNEDMLKDFNSKVTARRMAAKAAKRPSKVLINNFPHMGEQHSIVILMEFNDKQFSTVENASQYYNDAMNKEGFTAENGANGSVRDYFIASSYGAFKPTFDVYGPVQINYGQHDAGQGTNNTSINMGTFVKAAVEAIDAEVDFSQYDHDGDGYVDNVYIFYAGKGAADSNDSRTIWPHAFDMRDWGVTLKTNDGVSIGSYTCSNEVNGGRPNYPAGIGTFVHEFGHCLGLPDLYDTAGRASVSNYTPMSWDVMAYGNYSNDGNTPALYSSYERYELGWIEPEEITSSTRGVFSLPALGESNKAYKVNVPGNENEYFLFENRQQTGWDEYLPGNGMLVWHIDMDEKIWMANTVNNEANHQRVDIVEANGKQSGNEKYESGVTFPGTSNVTSYDFKAWNDEVMFYMDKAKDDNGIISFIAKGGDVDLMAPAFTVGNKSYDSFDLSWTAAEGAEHYLLNVKKVNADNTTTPLNSYTDKKVVGTKCNVTGLEPETQYEVSLKSCAGAFSSEEKVERVTTEVKAFSQYKVEGLKVTAVADNSFTASWTGLADAQTYSVVLAKKTFEGEPVVTFYDFSGKNPGMPYGWKTNSTTYSSASGSYGYAAPSLRFGTKGHYLVMVNQDAIISHVEFWMKPSKVSETAYIAVQRLVDGEWVDAEKLYLTESEGKMYYFDVEPASSVRLYFNRTGSETAQIDDAAVSGHGVKNIPVANYDNKNVGNVLTYTFTGLESCTTYILNVYGEKNGEKTMASDDLVVTTVDGSTSISGVASEGRTSKTAYDLSGRRVNKGNAASGVYIIRENGKAVKVAK